MNLEYKDILIKRYEDFESEENPERKKLLRSEVFNILKELEGPDTNDFHIWGLTYYMSDGDKEYHTNLALEKFLEAYELDSTNFLACLYVAHCFHDKGELDSALKYYERVNKEELKEFQIWRYVKLIEQIGFCNYKLGDKELGRKQFQEVLEWYRKLPMEDRSVPTEMIQCLPESDEIVIEMKEIEDYLN
ncbi:MAG: hypothetical protein RIF36_20105 [Imperialibacter sp.]|uniref:tetratricopeptide repeat protein n=1 Tax=Imperialibacter sp. TaxID=2038411 RepID=UPI0032EF145E